MSKATLVLVGFLILSEVTVAATLSSPDIKRTEVEAAVKAYFDAANRGDVYAMMALVSRREGVTSISDGQIQRGWQTIRNSNDQIVGREGNHDMSVRSIEVLVLSPNTAVAVAPFTFAVAYGKDTVRVPGVSSLVFERSGRRWFVVHEHTSIATQEVAHSID